MKFDKNAYLIILCLYIFNAVSEEIVDQSTVFYSILNIQAIVYVKII